MADGSDFHPLLSAIYLLPSPFCYLSSATCHLNNMTNYFNFFSLPVSPTVDQAALKKTFFANSKRFHPDFHTLKSDAEQQEALEKSTLNNQGYKTLRDDDRRLKHLLEVKGTLGAEGTNSVPQDFLMEMMEINEARMELEFDDDPAARQKVEALINGLEEDLQQVVTPVIERYNDDAVSPQDLEQLKDYYLKRRYLRRLRTKDEPEI